VPLVGLRVGGDQVVQTFGLEIVFGFRKAECDKSLNVGVTSTVDPSLLVLGNGIRENAAPLAGVTQIR
jgi:hypothetical protein